MRNLLVLSAAVSALALGVSTQQASALFPGGIGSGSEALVQKVQQKGNEQGSSSAQRKDTGARTDGEQAAGAAQNRGDRGGQARSDEQSRSGGKMRSSEQTRSGENRARGGRHSSSNVDVNVERGRHGFRNDRRTRVDVDVDRRRGSRGGDVGVRQSYGYRAGNCQEILRRYKQCVGR